jgi:hypothetical protein
VRVSADERKSDARGQTTASSFYRLREATYRRATWFFVRIAAPTSSTCDLMGVLMNPGSRRCRDGPYTRRGVASRVVRPAFTPVHRSYINLRVVLTGGACAVQGPAWRCPIGVELHKAEDGSIMPRMVAQGWGWPHRAGGDGGIMLCVPRVTTSS